MPPNCITECQFSLRLKLQAFVSTKQFYLWFNVANNNNDLCIEFVNQLNDS